MFENFRGPFYDDVIYEDIFEVFGGEMCSRKVLKLKGRPKSLPTAWGLVINRFLVDKRAINMAGYGLGTRK